MGSVNPRLGSALTESDLSLLRDVVYAIIEIEQFEDLRPLRIRVEKQFFGDSLGRD